MFTFPGVEGADSTVFFSFHPALCHPLEGLFRSGKGSALFWGLTDPGDHTSHGTGQSFLSFS